MPTRLLKLLDQLRSSYWFYPALINAVALIGAFAIVGYERRFAGAAGWVPSWLASEAAGGARAVLSTIAGSMISVATVAFSITIVVLTLASTQFGPRILHNFMRDRANQVVLGTFIGTFTYCLIVLMFVREPDSGVFVPHIAVSIALGLALFSVALLIFFIHHIIDSIQAPAVIHTIGQELREYIKCNFDPADQSGIVDKDPVFDEQAALDGRHPDHTVCTSHNGYLQLLDKAGLVELAEGEDCLLRLRQRPGDFLFAGMPLLEVYGKVDQPIEEFNSCVDGCAVVDDRNTALQNLEFIINELVEIGTRALSPGVNDPFTAIHCVDELGAGLGLLVSRKASPRVLTDSEGRARVIVETDNFAGAAAATYNQLRQHGSKDVAVSIRLLESIDNVLGNARTRHQREVLLEHAALICEDAIKSTGQQADKDDIQRRSDAITRRAETWE